MEDVFGMLDGRLRISLTDSTMMWIVHQAMDKAHRKVKSKEGVFQRLNQISRFYELAVILLQGCMKFLQEETDTESGLEKVIADLSEIRDRLQGRLKETELSIKGKDRELKERFENELKLKQALELRERELVSLQDNVELETPKIEGVVAETTLTDPVNAEKKEEDDKDGEICELMHSVDQQVLNIKHQLEPDYGLTDAEETYRGIDNHKLEQMGSDINILKETLDHAFGKMQNAILVSELEPQEQQWKLTIEKDVISTLIKCFMNDFRENFEVCMRKREKQVSFGLCDHLSDLMKEVTCIRDGLESLFNKNDATQSKSNIKRKIPRKARSLSEGDTIDSCNIFPSKDEEEEEQNQSHEDGQEEHGVAKLIKNHESIISRKSEELKWLKQEILWERTEKEPVCLKRRIQQVIVGLDNLISCNARIGENIGECDLHHGEENSPGETIPDSKARTNLNSGIDSLEDVWKKVNKASVSNAENDQLHNQMEIDTCNIDSLIREEISHFVFVEAVKGACLSFAADIVQERKSFIFQQKHNEEIHRNQYNTIHALILEFSQVCMNFELQADEKLCNNVLRLEEVKDQFHSLVELVASVREQESLYKKAFIRRCQNLRKAENEVDLLGDQVEVLLGLLEKIYITLHHYSPVLQEHFEILDILKLIQEELYGETSTA